LRIIVEGGAMAIRAILAVGLLSAAAVAQDVPVVPPPEIVVEGERPHVEAGMWEIHQWPARMMGPGWTIHVCIADESLEDAVARLFGRDNRYTAPGCSPVQVRIADGRLRGGISCTRIRAAGDPESPPVIAETGLHYEGTLTATRIDVRVTLRGEENGDVVRDDRTRLTAVRTGDCAAPAAVGRSTPLAPPAKVITALDPPVHRAEPPKEPVAGFAPAPAMPEAAAKPSVTESADDIVVVARRLRKLRLRYTSTGRRMYFCHADVSSGDKRVDRIGCAIVRSCVRAGFGETGPDIACFRRKVDSLEPD
jgi:hypothetical protein